MVQNSLLGAQTIALAVHPCSNQDVREQVCVQGGTSKSTSCIDALRHNDVQEIVDKTTHVSVHGPWDAHLAIRYINEELSQHLISELLGTFEIDRGIAEKKTPLVSTIFAMSASTLANLRFL